MNFSLLLFVAWAVLGGAWAWSSSEVSCASCGSECQAACGTRNFRACCFNFQRRRRSQSPLQRMPGSMGAAEWRALQGALLMSEAARRTDGPPLTQYLGYLDATAPQHPPPTHRGVPPRSLTSVLTALLQESSEEQDEEDLSAGGKEETESTPERPDEDAAFSRLMALALHHPPPSTLHQRYPPPPPPPPADVGK